MPGFETAAVWFRNRGCSARALAMHIFHQSKIYGESNRRACSKSFLRFKTKANTCDLSRPVTKEAIARSNRNEARPGSRDVFSASHGVLAGPRAGAVAQRKDA